MPKRKILLTELVPVFRHMDFCEWRDGRLCGELIVADQNMAALLGSLLDEDNADDYPCIVEKGNPDQIKTGDVFSLQFGAIRTAIGIIVHNVDALLSNSQIASGIAEQDWYVLSEDTASWELGKNLNQRLDLVSRLVRALEGAASIFDLRTTTLVFLRSSGRFDVPIAYGASDLMQIDVVAAEQLISQLELKDGHAAQRHEIGVTALNELLVGVSPEKRFSELLARLSELNQRFIDGYRLFASSFSYEKLRDAAEALRVEYSGKIHKTISDIQGQLLGIPISTIIVATQFKPTGSVPEQLWINCAVIVGAAIFFALLCLAVWNQKQTLDVIDSEIDRHETALRNEHADIASRLDKIFNGLRNRVMLHRIILVGIVGLCAVSLMFSFAVFWIFSNGSM